MSGYGAHLFLIFIITISGRLLSFLRDPRRIRSEVSWCARSSFTWPRSRGWDQRQNPWRHLDDLLLITAETKLTHRSIQTTTNTGKLFAWRLRGRNLGFKQIKCILWNKIFLPLSTLANKKHRFNFYTVKSTLASCKFDQVSPNSRPDLSFSHPVKLIMATHLRYWMAVNDSKTYITTFICSTIPTLNKKLVVSCSSGHCHVFISNCSYFCDWLTLRVPIMKWKNISSHSISCFYERTFPSRSTNPTQLNSTYRKWVFTWMSSMIFIHRGEFISRQKAATVLKY